MEPFCTRLKAVRGAESQASFAKKIGVTQVTYGRYELGVREPDLATLTRIGLVGNVSVDWLLGIKDGEKGADARKFQALKEAMQKLLDEYS
ncbi:MAG: helix-turn-helix transcriptional regulator [Kiritimatiellae bacterium]|nr:helix-turn-helix transcriptional regulator [Kiritimatiellia bacterium]